MHELSVCLALMKQVERVAGDHGARKVERIILRVGPLSGVEPALLRNAFPLAATGTVAEGARLDIETGPVRVRCTVCDQESEVRPNRLLCAHCGDFRTRVISGEEMLLQSIELDLPPERASLTERESSGEAAPGPA
ncbi:MAG: hydrogenase maturation nickel metallochaperone HypA [Gammaproteobacteria bacterium]